LDFYRLGISEAKELLDKKKSQPKNCLIQYIKEIDLSKIRLRHFTLSKEKAYEMAEASDRQ